MKKVRSNVKMSISLIFCNLYIYCSSLPSLVIKAIQVSCEDPKCPLLPPNKYTYFDRKTVVINKFDDDGTGLIEFTEFLCLMATKVNT